MANKCDAVSYIAWLQKMIVYKTPHGGEGVYSQLKVYCVCASFSLGLEVGFDCINS